MIIINVTQHYDFSDSILIWYFAVRFFVAILLLCLSLAFTCIRPTQYPRTHAYYVFNIQYLILYFF